MRVVQTPTGRLHLLLTNPETGEVLVDHQEHNVITAAGRWLLAELMVGTALGISKVELAVGGSRVPAEPGDAPPDPYPAANPEGTALYAEMLRVDAKFGAIDFVPANDQSPAKRAATPVSAVLPTSEHGPILTLREAGLVMTKIFGDGGELSEEVLYNHVVFAGPITKTPELQLTLTWEIIF